VGFRLILSLAGRYLNLMPSGSSAPQSVLEDSRLQVANHIHDCDQSDNQLPQLTRQVLCLREARRLFLGKRAFFVVNEAA
jgi:hypothetical protein